MSNQHVLKIHPAPLADLISGAKTAEVCRNDRDFQVGDTVRLMEVNPETGNWTGATDYVRTISHIQTGYGLPDGMCVLSYTQPAAGEPVTPIGYVSKHAAQDLADGKLCTITPDRMLDDGQGWEVPVYTAPPAAAPVAAGEPVSLNYHVNLPKRKCPENLPYEGALIVEVWNSCIDEFLAINPHLNCGSPAAHWDDAALWELLDKSVYGSDEQQVVARAKIRRLLVMRAQGDGGEA